MRKFLKWVKDRKLYILLLPVLFSIASTGTCGVLPLSPEANALITGDNSEFCAPFKIVSVGGLPLGPATISWIPIPGATGYAFMDSFGDTAQAPADAATVDMTINAQLAQATINEHGTFYFAGIAFTNSADHPACTASKSVTFTKTEMKKVMPHQSTPTPTSQPTAVGNPIDERCKSMKFLSVIPFGPAKINWSPYQHGYLGASEPYYHYWYNVVIEATTTDHVTIQLVNEWVNEPSTLPQSPSVKASFDYQLPPTKRIYSYTVRVTGGYATADYPDHINDGKGYMEPACSISKTLVVVATPTPLPPTPTPVPVQVQQPQSQSSDSHPQAPKPPKPASCPPGTTGDPSKGIPCIAVPK
jgi:hypothetical protein